MSESENMKNFDIVIRFYEELNDFIKNKPKKKDIAHSFKGKRSVKDLIESFGVPHCEVDLILVNGISVGFDYTVKNGDRISVYPVFEKYDIKSITKLRGQPLRETKFVVDVHLGKLARYLILLGFDTDYNRFRDDPELAEISKNQNRILLTCDRKLLMRSIIQRGIIIRNSDPFMQVVEVLDRLDLWDDVKPFTRCTVCNSKIVETSDDEFDAIFPTLPPNIKSWCKQISKCTGCGKLYWKGSHYDRLVLLVEKITNQKTR